MNKIILSAAIVGGLIAGPALAQSGHGNFDSYEDRAGAAYGEVVSSQPIYRSVRVSEPRKECWDERVVYNDAPQNKPLMTNGVVGGVIGAIAGGVAGHQFGKGRGKDAATALGVLIGAGIGHRVAVQNFPDRSAADAERVVYEERCKTVENVRTEQRIEGYDVNYRYNGRMYQTSLPYDPGSRIPIDVQVQPQQRSIASPYQSVRNTSMQWPAS